LLVNSENIIYNFFEVDKVDTREVNVKTLAYIGDVVYELYIREHVISNSREQVNKLHKKTIKYVSAKAQARIVANMDNEFSDEEKDIIRRGRNAEANTVPKNTDVVTYKIATGFESLIGFLYLEKRIERLEYIIDRSIKIIEEV
jgi:ribonuclease-3 family protein